MVSDALQLLRALAELAARLINNLLGNVLGPP